VLLAALLPLPNSQRRAQLTSAARYALLPHTLFATRKRGAAPLLLPRRWRVV